jgi:hypothetical protein
MSRPRPTPPNPRTARPKRRARGRWPLPKSDAHEDIEAVKWRVWHGWLLKQWRLAAADRPLQKNAAAATRLTQTAIARIESGERGLAVLELFRFAILYGVPRSEVMRFLRPPTTAEWDVVFETKIPPTTLDLWSALKRPPV